MRRVCALLSIARSTMRYKPRRMACESLRAVLRRLAAKHPRFGYRRLHRLVATEQGPINHKRVYKAYKEEGLGLSRRRTRKMKRVRLGKSEPPSAPNQTWAMDFISDSTERGQRFRVLGMIDLCTKESLCLVPKTSFRAKTVCRLLEQAMKSYGKPQKVRMDNGPEFRAKDTIAWFDRHGITQEFIEPGKPYQNGHCESFNARFRDECLDIELFRDLKDADQRIEAWRNHYNTSRPHSSLHGQTPAAFKQALKQALIDNSAEYR